MISKIPKSIAPYVEFSDKKPYDEAGFEITYVSLSTTKDGFFIVEVHWSGGKTGDFKRIANHTRAACWMRDNTHKLGGPLFRTGIIADFELEDSGVVFPSIEIGIESSRTGRSVCFVKDLDHVATQVDGYQVRLVFAPIGWDDPVHTKKLSIKKLFGNPFRKS